MENHLRTIRMLMERATVYRRALGPLSLITGAFGIVGALLARAVAGVESANFIIFWALWAIVTLVGAFAVIRAQAIRDREPVWSPPTRRIFSTLFPHLIAGAFAAVVLGIQGAELAGLRHLVALWMGLFGLALHSSGFFMRRGIRLFGAIFLGCAGLTAVISAMGWFESTWFADPNTLMGVFFGGLHLVYGLYLLVTEQGNGY